jgi:hypothetical protein
MDKQTPLEQAQETLRTLQDYDLNSLAQKDRLGPFSFEEAIAPAFRIVSFFQRIPVDMLKEFPQSVQENIKNLARDHLVIFRAIAAFDTAQANPHDQRITTIRDLQQRYESVFNQLHQWIAYASSKTTDFAGLTSEARQAVETIEKLRENVATRTGEAETRVAELEEQLRQSLAKQGVGKQAQYFENEAANHGREASKWGERTLQWAIGVAVLAVASLFTHRIPWLAPTNTPEAIQFVASKILLFGVLTFMLVRSSRNYMAHKHNEVVNRHKQNSLLTFNALVEAGATPETRNTVLNHAASSIYATPESGYVRGGTDSGGSNTTLVELLPRATARIGEGQ